MNCMFKIRKNGKEIKGTILEDLGDRVKVKGRLYEFTVKRELVRVL